MKFFVDIALLNLEVVQNGCTSGFSRQTSFKVALNEPLIFATVGDIQPTIKDDGRTYS